MTIKLNYDEMSTWVNTNIYLILGGIKLILYNLVEYENENQWFNSIESFKTLDQFQYGATAKAKKLKEIRFNLIVLVVLFLLVTLERIFYLTVRNSVGILNFIKSEIGYFALIAYILFTMFMGLKFYQELLKRKKVISVPTKLSLYLKDDEYYLTHFSFNQIKFKVLNFKISDQSAIAKLYQEQDMLCLYMIFNGKYETILRMEDGHIDNFVETTHANLVINQLYNI